VTYKSSILSTNAGSDIVDKPTSGTDNWRLPLLKNSEGGTLKINYDVRGNPSDSIKFTVEVIDNISGSVINNASKDLFIYNRPVSVKVNFADASGYFEPGKNVDVVISVTNESENDVKNLELLPVIKEGVNIMDWSNTSFTINNGSPTRLDRVITYSKFGDPKLETLKKGASVEYNYSMKVLPEANILTGLYKHSDINIYPLLTVKSSSFEAITEEGPKARVKSGMEVEQIAEYTPNKKQVKITWKIRNKYTPLKNFIIKAKNVLPPDSFDKSSFSKKDQMKLNDQNYLVWDVGEIPPYVGYAGNKDLEAFFVVNNNFDSSNDFLSPPEYSVQDSEIPNLFYSHTTNPIIGGTGAVGEKPRN
jgi:hypothetical protein